MNQIKLIAKTRHAKNRISQHGEIWLIQSETKDKFLLRSLKKTFNLSNNNFDFDLRWISKINDPNFIIDK